MKNSLEDLRNDALGAHIPIISLATEVFLGNYYQHYQLKNVLEIGSATGYSSRFFAHTIYHYSSDFSISTWEISYPHYFQTLAITQHIPEISCFYGDFLQFPVEKYLKKSMYDSLFIDGRKSETLTYLVKLYTIIQPTTHIIIDDVIKFKSKMQNLYDFLDTHKIHYFVERLDDDDGVMVIPPTQSLIPALSSLYSSQFSHL